MKKLTALVLALLLVFGLCACSGNSEQKDPTDGNTPQSETPLANNPTNSTVPPSVNAEAEKAKKESFEELKKYDVDLDLTGLNSNMLTAQIQEIQNDIKKYKGKTVRITGSYNQSYYEPTAKYYDYVFGYDDTGCCSAWSIEFYGDSVPKEIKPYTTVSMVGKIDTYEELGQIYTFVDVEHFAL